MLCAKNIDTNDPMQSVWDSAHACRRAEKCLETGQCHITMRRQKKQYWLIYYRFIYVFTSAIVFPLALEIKQCKRNYYSVSSQLKMTHMIIHWLKPNTTKWKKTQLVLHIYIHQETHYEDNKIKTVESMINYGTSHQLLADCPVGIDSWFSEE